MRQLIVLTIILIVALQSPVCAAELNPGNDLGAMSADSSDNPQVSKQALEILERSTDFISAAPAYTIIGESGYEVLQKDGQLLEFGSQIKLAVQRPSQANLQFADRDGANATLILDGDTISLFGIAGETYGYDTTHQPGDINTSLDFLATQFGIPRQMGYFLSKDLTASLSRVKSGYRVGEATIAGVLCDYLALRGEKMDVQVWIEQGDKPIPRYIVFTHRATEGQPRVWVRFIAWDLSPDLPEGIFTHSPPQDARRVRFFAYTPGQEPE